MNEMQKMAGRLGKADGTSDGSTLTTPTAFNARRATLTTWSDGMCTAYQRAYNLAFSRARS